VRPDGDDSSSAAVTAAKMIVKSFARFTKEVIELGTDWSKDGTHDSNAIEILVGATNYPETAELMSQINYGEYAVKVMGNKIVAVGLTEAGITKAADILSDNLVSAGISGGEGNLALDRSMSFKNKVDSRLAEIPMFDNGGLITYYNPGDNCKEIIVANTSIDDYKAYLKKLEDSGMKLCASHDITENSFAAYANDKYIYNVGFYYYKGEVRIIQEPYSEASVEALNFKNEFKPVTTSQITMLGLEYVKSDGTKAANGMSILIRLTDGRFIVVDGGFTKAEHADIIINNIKSQSAAYADANGGMKIAAWIVTHPHSDHNGMINKYYSRFSSNKTTVERFIYNFMSEEERNLSVNTYLSKGSTNWSTGEGGNWTGTVTAADSLKADKIIAHVGNVYKFADLDIEVLYTIESFGPQLCNALNTTSIILKMTFTDPLTGKVTTYMSTGDATGNGFEISKKMFGSYLKCDLLQVAHHGATTWGNDKGTMDAYRAIAPATLVWPCGDSYYPTASARAFNAVLLNKTTNPNFKEVYVAGTEGSTTIFPIPYTVGSAVQNKLPLK
ncbi:MAG: MBL fold metallo-hydrolase, partial [Clostridia bacterium]|nr:MBL fold metallo-hydrolase [Clostridia bacterium]